MQLLDDVLLLHEALDFIIEVFVAIIPVTLQDLNPQHVQLDKLGQVLNQSLIFIISTILNLDLQGQQFIGVA